MILSKKTLFIALTVALVSMRLFSTSLFADRINDPNLKFTEVHIFGKELLIINDTVTGMPAYCLDYDREYPDPGTTGGALNAKDIYDSVTYDGLCALLLEGYPYNSGGLNNKTAQAITQLCLWAWFEEQGYPGVNLVSGTYIETASNKEIAYIDKLMNAAKTQTLPSFEITTSSLTLVHETDNFVGTITVTTDNLANHYDIDYTVVPIGITVTGYTGTSGDILTFSVDESLEGQSIEIDNLLSGTDSRKINNLYYYQSTTSTNQRLVMSDTQASIVASCGLLMEVPNITRKPDTPTNPQTSDIGLFGIYVLLGITSALIKTTRKAN